MTRTSLCLMVYSTYDDWVSRSSSSASPVDRDTGPFLFVRFFPLVDEVIAEPVEATRGDLPRVPEAELRAAVDTGSGSGLWDLDDLRLPRD